MPHCTVGIHPTTLKWPGPWQNCHCQVHILYGPFHLMSTILHVDCGRQVHGTDSGWWMVTVTVSININIISGQNYPVLTFSLRCRECPIELQTKVHPKVRNHREGPY